MESIGWRPDEGEGARPQMGLNVSCNKRQERDASAVGELRVKDRDMRVKLTE